MRQTQKQKKKQTNNGLHNKNAKGGDYIMYSNDLYHHGILGQKWGLRRFQPYPKGYNGPGKTIGEASKKLKKY